MSLQQYQIDSVQVLFEAAAQSLNGDRGFILVQQGEGQQAIGLYQISLEETRPLLVPESLIHRVIAEGCYRGNAQAGLDQICVPIINDESQQVIGAIYLERRDRPNVHFNGSESRILAGLAEKIKEIIIPVPAAI